MNARILPFLHAYQRGINVLPYLRAVAGGSPPPPLVIPDDLSPDEATEAMRAMSAMAKLAAENALPNPPPPYIRRVTAEDRGRMVQAINTCFDHNDPRPPTAEMFADAILSQLEDVVRRPDGPTFLMASGVVAGVVGLTDELVAEMTPVAAGAD